MAPEAFFVEQVSFVEDVETTVADVVLVVGFDGVVDAPSQVHLVAAVGLVGCKELDRAMARLSRPMPNWPMSQGRS
jgi:hypothetical protein